MKQILEMFLAYAFFGIAVGVVAVLLWALYKEATQKPGGR